MWNKYCYNLGVFCCLCLSSSMICVKDDDFHPLSMRPLGLLLVFLFLFLALSTPTESNVDSSTMFFSAAARLLLLAALCNALLYTYINIYVLTFPFPSLLPSQTLPLTLGLHPPKFAIIIKASTIESFAAFHARLLASSTLSAVLLAFTAPTLFSQAICLQRSRK